MDGLAEWHFPPSGAIQLVQDADRAGRSLLTFGVDDRKEELVILRERASIPARCTTRPPTKCCSRQ
jgi:hypothetical protein